MEEIEKRLVIDDLRTAHFFLSRAMELLARHENTALENEVILCKSRVNEIIQEIREKEKL